MPNPNQVPISSKTQLAPRELGLTLKQFRWTARGRTWVSPQCSVRTSCGIRTWWNSLEHCSSIYKEDLNHALGLTLSTPGLVCSADPESWSWESGWSRPSGGCWLWSGQGGRGGRRRGWSSVTPSASPSLSCQYKKTFLYFMISAEWGRDWGSKTRLCFVREQRNQGDQEGGRNSFGH